MARFKLGDREYDFDGVLTLDEAMVLFDKAGVGVAEFVREQMRGNPYVLATIIYLLKKRAGEAARWEDMRHYNIDALEYLPDESGSDGDAQEEPAGEAPDPTKDAGTTPEPDTTNT